jgi:predicted hydrocarbon binding protein
MKQKDIIFEEGRIVIGGRRTMVMSFDSFIAIQKTIERVYGDKWENVIYNGVKKGAHHMWLHYLGKKGLDIADHPTNVEYAKNMLTIFNTTGFGTLQLSSLDAKKMNARFISRNSTIAEEYKDRGKPVCYFTAAIIASLMGIVFGKDMDCKEVKCRAKGDPYCEFVVQNSGGNRRG